MKKIALSIDEMKHLEELGLDTSDASMKWRVINEVHEIELSVNDWGRDITKLNNFKDICDGISFYPAYTLQDILEKLPKHIHTNFNKVNGMDTTCSLRILLEGTPCITYDYQVCDDDGNFAWEYYIFKENPSLLESSYQMLL